jgi:hypothetical protein
MAEAELALRRQLSRLQRQLADAQRELANKEEELAAEFERRGELAATYAAVEAQLRDMRTAVEELGAYRSRTAGIEQRLIESEAEVEELRAEIDHERSQQAGSSVRVEEMATQLATQRAKWADERAHLEREHSVLIGNIEAQKRVTLEEADRAFEATVTRMREGHAGELAQARDSYERQLQAVRGELEPKALEAANLAEDRERLAAENEALRTSIERELKDLMSAHDRELQQMAITHTDDQNALLRAHGLELAKLAAERDAKTALAADTQRAAEQREALVEQTVTALRENAKKLQLELADAKEKLAQADGDRASSEARLQMASRAAEHLVDENRVMRERVEETLAEARRNELDRKRFVAYLEEGLAMLGALPEKPSDD